MGMDLTTAKDIATIAAPLTTAVVETWIKPKLAKLHKYLKTEKEIFEDGLSSKFEEYLLRSYERQSYITTIVFQNQQKKLKDLYIPLTVVSIKPKVEIKIDSYNESFMPKYEKVLIVDTAGMGKSTLMKYLFLSCIDSNKGIPIFIVLRKLARGTSILDFIYNELNPIDDEFDKDFILKLIKRGDFVFFLDGYDEIPFGERESVTESIQDFVSKAGNNHFVMTSRPEGALTSFSDFKRFSIQPLALEEAFALLRKYDQGEHLAEEIINKLKGSLLHNLREFLVNPLLVSLLFKSYEYKHTFPLKKHIFYRQVYDALFESHDLSKPGGFIREKYSGLDIEEFHRVLRSLGFITAKLGKIEFDRDELINLIRESKSYCIDLNFKESQFLKDLLVTVPLFNRDGGYYKWSHKSIQDYFAAQFITIDSKSKQGIILQRMWANEEYYRYFNILDLCCDMDSKTFRKVIVYELLNRFFVHYESSYSEIDRGIINERSVHIRKILTFGLIQLLTKSGGGLANASEEEAKKRGGIPEEYQLYIEGGTPYVLVFSSYVTGILDLLKEKNFDIFSNEAFSKINVYTLNIHERVQDVVSSELRDKEFMKIDDNPDSPFNQKETFDLFNKFIASHELQLLDYDKCVHLREQIRKDIEEEAKVENFLIDNI